MAENSPYFDSIVADRAIRNSRGAGGRLDEDEVLEGQTTISLETCPDMTEEDILTYVQEQFPDFLKILRFLSKEDQELLLSYYILSKTQNTLALIHKSTQTVCSFRIRQAVKRIGTFMMLGAPTEEVMVKVFKKAGLENELPVNSKGDQIGLSKVVSLYESTRSFQQVADTFGLHRPDIRRTMSRAAKTLNDSKDPQDIALGAFVHGLIDKASASGQGFSKRKLSKLCHIYRTDPPILGEFRIDVQSPDFKHLFTSRANR
jgi:hypothetical protein